MSNQPQFIFSNESGNGPIFSVMSSDGLLSASLNIDSNGIIEIAGQFAASMSYAINSNTSSVSIVSNTSSYVSFTNVANTPTLVSSSAQVNYNNISNIPVGIISSSAQVSVNLPAGVVSSSAQASTWTVATASFVTTAQTSSFVQWTSVASKPVGLVSGSIQVLSGSGVYSSSVQLPAGLVSGSSQISTWTAATASYVSYASVNAISSGWVSSSIQILSGSNVYSSSVQLPVGLVSGSSQISTWTAATASYVSYASVNAISSGWVSSSIQVLSGSNVYSSSAQLPVGVVSSSAQASTWTVATASFVTTAQTASFVSTASFATTAQTASFVQWTSISSKPVGLVSGSIQVLSGSGVYSSSAQLPSGLVSGSSQISTWTAATASYVTLAQTASYVNGNSIVSSGYSCVTKTTSQTITAGNTFTSMPLDTNVLTDSTDWTYSNGAATLTCVFGGIYFIDVTVYLQKTGGTAGTAGVRITKNGTEIPGSYSAYTFTSNNVSQAITTYAVSQFSPTDVLAVQVISSRASDFKVTTVPSIGTPGSTPSAMLRVSIA